MEDNLKQAFQQIVNDFGPDIINDKNLANIVADYYSFDRNPAVRNILKAIVSGGYAVKIGQLKSSKGDPSIDLERYAGEIEQSWGYAKEQVRFVLSCIAKCVGINYRIEKSRKQEKKPKLPPQSNLVVNLPKINNINSSKIKHQPKSYNKTWLHKVTTWQWCLILLILSVVLGWLFAFSKLIAVVLIVILASILFLIENKIELFSNNTIVTYFCVSVCPSIGFGGGYIYGNYLKDSFEETEIERIRIEVDRMVKDRDTLALFNYIDMNSENSTLNYELKNEIRNKYDSLKYVMMGCDKIVDDMITHAKVLKSYGFSDVSIKNMYSKSFCKTILTLLDYQPNSHQQNREYMVNKIIAYMNYIHYPWNEKDYANWRSFSYDISNNPLLQCNGYPSTLAYRGIESFQVRFVKENDVWIVDDYISNDGTSLKDLINRYIKGL